MAVVENIATVDLGNITDQAFNQISNHQNTNFSSNDQHRQQHHLHHNNDNNGSAVQDQSSLKPSHFQHQQSPTAPMVQVQPADERETGIFNQTQQQRSSISSINSKEMKELEDMFSKLNPMAAEFVPPSLSHPGYGFKPAYYVNYPAINFQENFIRRSNANNGLVKRRMKPRTNEVQGEHVVRKTVYVSDIDQQVTEEQLATLFTNCGQVVDCRICGDTNSVLRFAFVEFTDEEGARAALSLSGTMLGYYPVRVLPSKTAIAPVNQNYLPRSDDEREMCARTIYCTNIDKKVGEHEVRLFFESICGQVHRLRLLGDRRHHTRIGFVEFVMAESATAALNCSGVVLGSLPIRVSPSKTPVHPRAPRSGGR